MISRHRYRMLNMTYRPYVLVVLLNTDRDSNYHDCSFFHDVLNACDDRYVSM